MGETYGFGVDKKMFIFTEIILAFVIGVSLTVADSTQESRFYKVAAPLLPLFYCTYSYMARITNAEIREATARTDTRVWLCALEQNYLDHILGSEFVLCLHALRIIISY